MKEMLDDLTNISNGTLDVVRTDPDGQIRIFVDDIFLSDYLRTHEGDLPIPIADGSSLTGTNANTDIDELRTGTKKQVSKITITQEEEASLTISIEAYIDYDNEKSIAFSIYPYEDSNNVFHWHTSQDEVKTITTTTADTSTSGGDYEVDKYLQFRLRYGSEVTKQKMT